MFEEAVIREITKAARRLDIEPATLLAVAETESGGKALAVVNGKKEPLIRFEGHYFDRRLNEVNRVIARAKGLASPIAGAIANPTTQPARWRLLEQAAAIDQQAAYESASWGLGQVMGAHWKWLGYASVEALVTDARSGIAGQTRLMALYIQKAGLTEALRRHDWKTFAHGYNGPAYSRNAYDLNIATAYRRYAAGKEATQDTSPLLRQGSKGEAVADMQRSLAALGYPLPVDGDFGPLTTKAVKRFQASRQLDPDGIVGPKTFAALNGPQVSHGAPRTVWTGLKGWLAGLFGRP